ncbi:hypothetical protein DES45_101533 [Microvirga subterranea]|uniref:Uncharacterized protein n=2 Tax=Microvirga subterranea TaxID=186651 RepID=A0A370HV38_9HYPH|nr:hypothetical protein DES45_101533 [Microvirga subterranea]
MTRVNGTAMPLADDSAQAINADFLHYVETCFPQWLQCVRRLKDEDSGGDYLELTIPDPAGITHEHPLEISTWGEEVTVSFGDYHTHFPWPQDHDGAESRDRVSGLIGAFLNEKLVTLSVWHEGRCKLGSTTYSSDLDRYRQIAAGDHELRIKSWRGTYNTVLPIDWHGYLKTLPSDLLTHLKASFP